MTPRHTFRLGFVSDHNTKLNLNFPHADLSASADTVRQAMDTIINSAVVRRNGAQPVTRATASIITHTTTDFGITAGTAQ